jgi:hypothetical protein
MLSLAAGMAAYEGERRGAALRYAPSALCSPYLPELLGFSLSSWAAPAACSDCTACPVALLLMPWTALLQASP